MINYKWKFSWGWGIFFILASLVICVLIPYTLNFVFNTLIPAEVWDELSLLLGVEVDINQFFNFDLILINGIILTCAIGFWGLCKSEYFLKFIGYLLVLGIIIYLYFAGNNILTFFMPAGDYFGSIYLEFIGVFWVSFVYTGFAIIILATWILSTAKSFLVWYRKENQSFRELFS